MRISHELHSHGLYKNQIKDLLLWHFNDDKEAASYFGVTPTTIKNWKKSGNFPVSVIRLLLIIHRGYLPTSKAWRGFRVRNDKLYTPTGREISAYDLQELDIKVGLGVSNVIQFRRKKKRIKKKNRA